MDVYNVMYNFINALLPIGICVILPIIVVWLIIRERINRDNMRKDIILAAMEKNTDIDVEEMMKKLNGPKKLLKGIIVGGALLTFVLSTPPELPLFTFHASSGILLAIEQYSRTVATIALSLIMGFGIISIISNILDIAQMKASI